MFCDLGTLFFDKQFASAAAVYAACLVPGLIASACGQESGGSCCPAAPAPMSRSVPLLGSVQTILAVPGVMSTDRVDGVCLCLRMILLYFHL